MGDELELDDGYSQRVGERLRAIRRQKRLSLHDVEAASNLEFKASVLGAYERGERAISVPRLHRLATVYNVPVDQLLPREPNGTSEIHRRAHDDRSVTIDLTRLHDVDAPGIDLLIRYVETIQVQRQDFNGRMLTVRHDDLRAIACILDAPVDTAVERLESLGLCLS